MDRELRAYVRRQWRWYAAAAWAQVAGSAGISLYLFLRFDQRTVDHAVFPVLANAFFVAYSYFIIDRNAFKPHTWLGSTARFGGAAWAVMFLYYCGVANTNSFAELPPLGVPAFGLAVLCVVALIVAGRAKGKALEDVSLDEIMNADLGTRFEVRDNDAVFHVDHNKVMLFCTVRLWRDYDGSIVSLRQQGRLDKTRRTSVGCPLVDIKKMRAIYIRRPRTIPMPGDGRRMLKISPGPALRFDSPGGEWIVSTNRAQDAYDVIRDKRAKFRKSDPGYRLGSFLPKNL
ncbi:MAG TPA: hypothetical protein VGP26_13805 [Actinophytocola sp.]|jgi:hypothetical protein|nr:hypothetical protein [Actinophytocola sp.]